MTMNSICLDGSAVDILVPLILSMNISLVCFDFPMPPSLILARL